MISGQQLQEFVNAITSAFTSDTLDIAVQFRMDEQLAALVNTNQALVGIAFDLVRWAERHGQTDTLALELQQYNSSNPKLNAYCEKYLSGVSVENNTASPSPTKQPTQSKRPNKLSLSKALAECETMKSSAARQTLLSFLSDAGLNITFVDNQKLLASKIITACITVEPHQLNTLVDSLEFLENENASAFLKFKALVKTY